jgi:hypothetical protein
MSVATSETAVWEFAVPQRTPVHGSKSHPSVRYSASAVSYKGELVVTHGYFYNHAIRHPAWQSDAWAFNYASRKWRRVHEGEQAGAPSARYSASSVLFDDALWMFGGDDGGHKRSMFNYVFKAWFNELWRFDLRTYVWHKVPPNNAPPPKRALHAAVAIGRSMYVYGGLELADTWRYDFDDAKWTLLLPAPAESDESHPGARARARAPHARLAWARPRSPAYAARALAPSRPLARPRARPQVAGTHSPRRVRRRTASTSSAARAT